MTIYKGYEIIPVTESYLKGYGAYLWSKPGHPGSYAKSMEDAKRQIDNEIWEDEKRYSE
jgi:hypothetical protein